MPQCNKKGHRHGTEEECCYCGKDFGPDYAPSRKHIHYVFRIRTIRGVTFFGPIHSGCVERLRAVAVSGIGVDLPRGATA